MPDETPSQQRLPFVAWNDDRECDYSTSVEHLAEMYEQLALFAYPRDLSRNQLMALLMTMLSAIVQGIKDEMNKSEMDLKRFELFTRQIFMRTEADIESGYIDVICSDNMDRIFWRR
jgi:hypothetical protein